MRTWLLIHANMILFIGILLADPAKITINSDSVLVGPGEGAYLSCQIDANPLDESMVQWTYGGSPVSSSSRIERKFEDNKSFLNIDKVTKEDEGWYTCHVDNGIGQPSNTSIFLIVKRELPPVVKFLSIRDHSICTPLTSPTHLPCMHMHENVFSSHINKSS